MKIRSNFIDSISFYFTDFIKLFVQKETNYDFITHQFWIQSHFFSQNLSMLILFIDFTRHINITYAVFNYDHQDREQYQILLCQKGKSFENLFSAVSEIVTWNFLHLELGVPRYKLSTFISATIYRKCSYSSNIFHLLEFKEQ